MNSKLGMSLLVLGVIMLLIPATAVASAQEYDKQYEYEQYEKIYEKSYNEQYKKDNREKSDEPVIIIKNEPIQKKEKKKMMKESPMLLVKKDVLYCDSFSGSDQSCRENGNIVGPNSGRYVQECTTTDDDLVIVCNSINEEFFKMIVTDDIEFAGSEDGTKLNFNGERYTVSEDVEVGEIGQNEVLNSRCQEAGFDSGFFANGGIEICTLNEGECSGIIQDGELKECTIENYVITRLL